MNNDLVKHNLETNHNFDFEDFKMLVYIHNKKYQKIIESSIISNHNTVKQKLGFFQFVSLSLYLVKLVLKSYKIPYLK